MSDPFVVWCQLCGHNHYVGHAPDAPTPCMNRVCRCGKEPTPDPKHRELAAKLRAAKEGKWK